MAFSNTFYYYQNGVLRGTYNPGKLEPFGNSWDNSYTKFVILEAKLHFTCGD